MHAPVRPIQTTDPSVIAFDIPGEVSEEDLEHMARTMEAAFETRDKVSLLLSFENYEGNELGALLDGDVVRTHFKSLSGLDRYAVVGAPAHMNAMLETLSAIIPVEAKTFDKDEIDQAWAHVGAHPVGAATA